MLSSRAHTLLCVSFAGLLAVASCGGSDSSKTDGPTAGTGGGGAGGGGAGGGGTGGGGTGGGGTGGGGAGGARDGGAGTGGTDAAAGTGGAPAGDGGEVNCMGMANGADCGAGSICVNNVCGSSRCGDGYVDSKTGEE